MNRTTLLSTVLVVIWGLFSINMVSAQAESKTSASKITQSKTVTSKTDASKTGAVKATPAKPATPATPASAAKKTGVASANPANAHDLSGYWLTAQKGSIVEFIKKGDTYEGKIVWSKTIKDRSGKELKDVNNPDKSKRNAPIIGSTMITGLKYNPKNDTYEGGKIYQYQSGKSYNCKVNLDKNKNVMKIVGGVGFISKTLTWTRTSGVPGK